MPDDGDYLAQGSAVYDTLKPFISRVLVGLDKTSAQYVTLRFGKGQHVRIQAVMDKQGGFPYLHVTEVTGGRLTITPDRPLKPVAQEFVSPSGRHWRAEATSEPGKYWMQPLGDDVSPAQARGKMSGGVRRKLVDVARLDGTDKGWQPVSPHGTRQVIETGDGSRLLLADPPQLQDNCPKCDTLRTETTVSRGRMYCPSCRECRRPTKDAKPAVAREPETRGEHESAQSIRRAHQQRAVRAVQEAHERTERHRTALRGSCMLVCVAHGRALRYGPHDARHVEEVAERLAMIHPIATHILVKQGALPWSRWGERKG